MTHFKADDDVQERYREIKDHYYQTYPAGPWEEEYIESTAKDRAIMLKNIDKDIVEPAMDIMDDVKEQLNHALLMIYDLDPLSTRYQKLKEKRIQFSNVCMNTTAMLEISAMYLVYMTSRQDEATLGSSVNVFRGRH